MLAITDILNILEVVKPDEPLYDSLSKLYYGRDVDSFYNLSEYFYGEDIVKMRNAFQNDNLFPIFHMLEHRWNPDFDSREEEWNKYQRGDLRKFMINGNMHSFMRIIQEISESELMEGIRQLIINEVDINTSAFDPDYLQRQMWMIEELKECYQELKTTFLCAGWYGTLIPLMIDNGIEFEKVRSFDVDPEVCDIAEKINKKMFCNGWQFKASTYDISDFAFTTTAAPSDKTVGNLYYETKSLAGLKQLKDKPDTFINLDCDHIKNFFKWYDTIRGGSLLILQSSNDTERKGHVHTCHDEYCFAEETPMSKVMFQGTKEINGHEYYMRIGFK